MKEWFKRKTLKVRHKLAKILVPRLYEDWLMHGGIVQDDVPRPMILAAKKHFKGSIGLVGAEIGVFEGVNALNILRELPMKRLYLIDPYIDTEFAMYLMKERITACRETRFIRATSEEAFYQIVENLDFVYIDGDHSYDAVKKDIKLYFLITKKNGIIGGHDYSDVKKAVDEFVAKNRSQLNLGGNDWWIIKQSQ